MLQLLVTAARSPLSLADELLRQHPFVAIQLRDRVMADGLADRLGRLGVDALADHATRLAVRNAEAFAALADRVRRDVAPSVSAVVDELVAIARSVAAIDSALGDSALAPAVRDDIERQLAGLFPTDFPAHIEFNNYNNLRRYCNAITYRLEKLGGRVQRDRDAMATIQRLLRRLTELPASVAAEPAAQAYRWALEELRVSLFAEPLGTAYKVSPKRLERLWQDVLRR